MRRMSEIRLRNQSYVIVHGIGEWEQEKRLHPSQFTETEN